MMDKLDRCVSDPFFESCHPLRMCGMFTVGKKDIQGFINMQEPKYTHIRSPAWENIVREKLLESPCVENET